MVDMNRMDTKRRAQVVRCLIEGCSINSTVRMTGVAKHTVLKLLVELGAACGEFSIFLENALVKRVNRLMDILMVRIAHSKHPAGDQLRVCINSCPRPHVASVSAILEVLRLRVLLFRSHELPDFIDLLEKREQAVAA